MSVNKNVGSPCIGVCVINNEYCLGCFRTLEEIEAWSNLSEAKKLKLIKNLKNREDKIYK